MNQILLTNKQDIKKGGNKYRANNSGDMKKIIIFFSIAILVFAALIIGISIYKLNKDKEEVISKPELSLEQTDTEVKIIAKAKAGIDKIIYTWNDEEPNEKEMNGRTSHEEKLEIPEGQNKLTVKVIDQNGEEIETKQDLYREKRIQIDETIGNGKVKITATDENNSIKYITYRWNNDEETTVEAEEENQAVLETVIDIKRGKNTLYVSAINGLAKEETAFKILQGAMDPAIDVTREENTVYMKITHDMGFKEVKFTVNGQEYIYDENYSGYDAEKQEIVYKYELKEGNNSVVIKAVSNELVPYGGNNEYKNTEATYTKEYSYVAQPEEIVY